MRLLLDTHAFLWFIEGSTRLTPRARELIEEPGNESVLSVASLWEMAIKANLGRLELGMSFEDLHRDHIEGNAIEVLGIQPPHLDIVAQLPQHHRDPFDRLLIAQATCEGIGVLSKDEALDAYGVKRLW